MKTWLISLFAFICIIGCWQGQEPTNKGNSNGYTQKNAWGKSKKIIVRKEQVYDLSGYEDEGKGKPFNLFDENDFVDPRSQSSTSDNYIPVTDPQPTNNPAVYFPKERGNRIVTDLLVPYQISDIYLYDHSNNNDSIWVYAGDMLHWKLKAAFVTVGTSSLWGWRKFSLNDSTQYIMIRFSSYEKAITEMVLYGSPYKPVPILPDPKKNTSQFSKTMMKDFVGANNFQPISAAWAKPFHFMRLYSFAFDFDNDSTHPYPQNKYNMRHFADWGNHAIDDSFFFDRLVKENHSDVWFSVIGLSASSNKGDWQNNRPVTVSGMDPENPLSYARHSNMMWNIAAYFGNNDADPNLVQLEHKNKKSRKGVMSVYENGNEEDAIWFGQKYQNPMEYFAQSSADYDGHEAALPKNCGIKNADNSSKLMTSGMIELDTNRVRVYKFLCNTLRKDKKFIWDGGVQYHHYSTDGKHGISPEEDSMRSKLAKARAATYRIQPDVPCYLGENGYDKNQQSRQSTPMLPGFSEEQCQAIFIIRSINATAFSGFDAYILYWLIDNQPTTEPSVYLTSGALYKKPDGSIQPYISWFHISTFVNRLANYMPDEIVSENGNAWVYKYRNKFYTDSVAYFVYCPTHNGTKLENYRLIIGKTENDNATEVEFIDNDVNGKQTNKKTVQGFVSMTVEEKPKIVLAKETR